MAKRAAPALRALSMTSTAVPRRIFSSPSSTTSLSFDRGSAAWMSAVSVSSEVGFSLR